MTDDHDVDTPASRALDPAASDSAELADLTLPGEFTDYNKGRFIDWSKLDLYQLQRGEGECAV